MERGEASILNFKMIKRRRGFPIFFLETEKRERERDKNSMEGVKLQKKSDRKTW